MTEPCHVCKGTRWIVLYELTVRIEAACFVCNMDGQAPECVKSETLNEESA
jgi:hypothetical protein